MFRIGGRSISMLSVPYSRKLFGFLPWYSFLIVLGAALAISLAVREEKRTALKKDTVLDFVLWALPCGIVGARIYYVIFSWSDFSGDLLSVFKIWEGGIAIYGAVIAGLLTAYLFSRKRSISFFTLCDLIAPGLVLAQAIGRWGNYFNQECYGLPIQNPSLCFFPFGVQIQSGDGLQWHMATFFYESVWNFFVFLYLMIARRKWFKYNGDVICFYAFLYACGRLIIEDFRMDSLYASSTVRVSQLLSVMICMLILIRYLWLFRRDSGTVRWFLSAPAFIADIFLILWMTGFLSLNISVSIRFLLLLLGSSINISVLFILYGKYSRGKLIYADIQK